MRAWETLMGKRPLMPNMLPVKRLEAPLTTATQASVPMKNCTWCSDTSTFTSTVVRMKTSNITHRDARMRTRGDNLEKSDNNMHLEPIVFVQPFVTVTKSQRASHWMAPS